MAGVSLKKDFVDGEKLFAQQLNNNFGAIQAALETMNKIVWQDDPDASLLYFKGTTEEVSSRENIEGQLLYDYILGRTFIDHDGNRIDLLSSSVVDVIVNTFSGDEINKAPSVHITKERIDNKVVDSLNGNEIDKAPSVKSVKNAHKYSTNEIKTGETWIDGKPLYTKTINFGNLPNNANKNVEHEIQNYDVIFVDFSASYATNNSGQFQGVNSVGLGLTTYINGGDVVCITNSDRTSWVAVITIKYTKTTD